MQERSLVVLSDVSYPDTNAGASRIYERLKYWALSYDVHLITQQAANGIRLPKEREQNESFTITRFIRSPFESKGLMGRALSYLWFSLFSFFYLLFRVKKRDILFVTSPQFLNLIVAYLVSRIKRADLVYEISDLWPDILSGLNIIEESSYLFKFWIKLEKFLYMKADKIIALTPLVKERIIEKGIQAEKVFSVINGFEDHLWSEADLENDKESFTVGYYGTIGRVIDVELFLETAKRFQEKYKEAGVNFKIAGQGVKVDTIKEFQQKNKAVSLCYMGEVPKSKMQELWSCTDLCFIPLVDLDIMKPCIPAKILECVGVVVPVLLSGPAGCDGEKLINKYILGEADSSYEVEAIVDLIFELSDRPERYEKIKRSMRENRSFFTREKQALEVLEVLSGL